MKNFWKLHYKNEKIHPKIGVHFLLALRLSLNRSFGSFFFTRKRFTAVEEF